MRKVLSFWITPFRASTWHRFGSAVLAAPVSLACLVLALAGRIGTAARYQRRLAGRSPAGRPARWRNVVVCSLASLAIGLVSWVLLQDLAYLMLLNIAYPARVYISVGDHTNFLPWDGWNLLWSIRFHRATGPNPWANNYTTSWGGPTLAGAWAVHAGLSLLTIYPVLAWAVRGLVRLQRRLAASLLGGPTVIAYPTRPSLDHEGFRAYSTPDPS
jgi:hypothetical protein